MLQFFTIKKIIFATLYICLDLAIYIILGIMLMGYDDFYDESKGEYWSLASMTTFQKGIYFGLMFWNILNVVVIVFLIFKGITYLKKYKSA